MKTEKNISLDRSGLYTSPQVRVISVNVQNVLCQSGNGPMREYDYGNGGFSEN